MHVLAGALWELMTMILMDGCWMYNQPQNFVDLKTVTVPRHNLSFGSRVFRISAPEIWSSLLPHILRSQTLLDAIWRPTTFSQPTLPPSAHPQCVLILFWDFGSIILTYILTYSCCCCSEADHNNRLIGMFIMFGRPNRVYHKSW